MVLLCDAGSTKAHWCLMAANGHTEEVYTDGINPMFQTHVAMRQSISNQLLPEIGPSLWAGTLTHIFFYGAGCTPEKIPFVEQALQEIFKKAEIHVGSDMLGAARGLLEHEAGVACILGTGSGSCYYDGEKIAWNVPSLGYILGDEGSGAVMGKRLIGDILKNQLGEELKEQFMSEMELTVPEIFEKVYRQAFPNRFLASLNTFCEKHIENPIMHDFVYRCLDDFVSRNVVQYPEDKEVGFVGSIAFIYKDILEEVMQAHGRKMGRITRDPIEGLGRYHKPDCVPTN